MSQICSVFQFDLSQITTGSTLETVYLRLYVASTSGNRSTFDVDLPPALLLIGL